MYSYAIKVYEIVIYLCIFILKKEWETTLEKKKHHRTKQTKNNNGY